jgi:hypothetical protein
MQPVRAGLLPDIRAAWKRTYAPKSCRRSDEFNCASGFCE